MRTLQDRLKDTKIQFVSISVDPKYDTPEVLDRYAKANGAQPGRWHFLTGPRDYTYALINDRFHLPVSEATKEAMDRGDEMVLHSDRLVLVDRGNRVVNYYSSEDADKVKDLIERARRLDAAAWVRRLPAVNAALNGTCVVFLLMGWGFIRNFKPVPHIACMIAALTVSAAFLTCYLIYHFQVGSMPFRGVGWTRHVYYTVLLSHTVLAAAVVPMLAITITRAVRKRYPEHARFSRTTFPVWLYVSITGVLIYMMLYQLPAPG